MTVYTLRLPWAERILHANQNLHWADQNRRRQTVRHLVKTYAKIGRLPKGVGFADVTLTWHPKARYRTDANNLEPMLKPALDGLVDYGLIPDDTPEYVDARCRIGEPQLPAHFLLTIEVPE